MSRIGKKPIAIRAGVDVKINGNQISVKGPKGLLVFNHRPEVSVKLIGNEIKVEEKLKKAETSAIWGTTTRIIENMIKGVTDGFEKKLELNGVGYRMSLQGKKIMLALGFSHPIEVPIPDGLNVKIEQNVITVEGIDKQRVGQFAAEIRRLKPVEPYKGKGFRYVGEVVRKKEGKKATSSA